MFEIGEYVEVDLGTEIRRGIVATIEANNNRAEVILLKGYGNNQQGELIDDAEFPSFPLSSIRKLGSNKMHWMDHSVKIEELRGIAAKFFSNKDWRGAITVYNEILHRLEYQDEQHSFLLRADNVLRLGQSQGMNDGLFDYGIIDPSSDAQFAAGEPRRIQIALNPDSLFRVFTPFHLHATILLNKGRALVNAELANEGVDVLSFAIYVSALSQDPAGRSLRSKCYFWRAKVRMTMNKLQASLRDANSALMLCDLDTRRECQVLVQHSQEMIRENRTGMRIITRELMQLIDGQIREGKLDFNI